MLESIESSTALLANPIQTVKWNLDKSYLRELEDAGLSVVPTIWAKTLDVELVSAAQKSFAQKRVVVKPTVGANADNVFVVDNNADLIVSKYTGHGAMVQPFLPSIGEEGEYSLIYFSGAFSHAVVKKPARDDFRVQEEHGGSVELVVPDTSIRELADRVVKEKLQHLLYARIDICRLPDRSPAIMEVELIEPSLFFNYAPGSALRFAKATDHLYDLHKK